MEYKKGDPVGYTGHHEYVGMSLADRLKCLRKCDAYRVFHHPTNSIFRLNYIKEGWYYKEHDGSPSGPFGTQEEAEMACGMLYRNDSE